MNRTASFLAALVLLAPLAARAAVPGTVAFSARIADNGRPVTGAHNFTFAFYDADTAGNQLWKWSATDTPAALTVNDGVVSYALGSDNPIPVTVFSGAAVYLEVSFDGVTLSPRVAIQSVPYAIRAGNVAQVAFASRTTSLSLAANGACTNYLSVSLAVPGPGTVVVEGLVRAELYHGTLGGYDYGYAYVSTLNNDCGTFYNAGIGYALNDPVGWLEFNLPSRRAFTVTGPGTVTFYMNGQFPSAATGSSFVFYQGNLSATFYSN